MRMTNVTYSATINLGNFETERIEIVAEIDNSDGSITAVVDALREHVAKNTFKTEWLASHARNGAGAASPAKVASVREVKTDPFAALEGD